MAADQRSSEHTDLKPEEIQETQRPTPNQKQHQGMEPKDSGKIKNQNKDVPELRDEGFSNKNNLY